MATPQSGKYPPQKMCLSPFVSHILNRFQTNNEVFDPNQAPSNTPNTTDNAKPKKTP
jgi:hypothetical protein